MTGTIHPQEMDTTSHLVISRFWGGHSFDPPRGYSEHGGDLPIPGLTLVPGRWVPWCPTSYGGTPRHHPFNMDKWINHINHMDKPAGIWYPQPDIGYFPWNKPSSWSTPFFRRTPPLFVAQWIPMNRWEIHSHISSPCAASVPARSEPATRMVGVSVATDDLVVDINVVFPNDPDAIKHAQIWTIDVGGIENPPPTGGCSKAIGFTTLVKLQYVEPRRTMMTGRWRHGGLQRHFLLCGIGSPWRSTELQAALRMFHLIMQHTRHTPCWLLFNPVLSPLMCSV